MGLARRDFREALRHEKPRSITQLMKVANEWADVEDSVQNERHRSPHHDNDEGN